LEPGPILGNKQAKQAVGLLLACLQIWTGQLGLSLLDVSLLLRHQGALGAGEQYSPRQHATQNLIKSIM
jgi:hypothetical protein